MNLKVNDTGYLRRLVLLLILIGAAGLPGCGKGNSPPEQALYVLSGGRNFMNYKTVTALTIVDTETWEIQRKVRLPKLKASPMALDPEGRIWISFGRTQTRGGKEVHLYDGRGNRLKKLETCNSPRVGIAFAAGRAFVACEENGFYGKVDVFDLQSLERVSTLDLQDQILVAIAADENYVLVSGLTDRASDYEGPDTAVNFITLINPHSLEIKARSERLYDTGVRKILPYQGKFYLLNYESFRRPAEKENDLIIVTPGDPLKIEEQALPVDSPNMSPNWGRIVGDKLYVLQAFPSGFNRHPDLGISRLDLKTGEVESWPLTESRVVGYNKDIVVIDDGISGDTQVILSYPGHETGEADEGLYRVDLASGQVTQVLHVPGAQKFLLVQQ